MRHLYLIQLRALLLSLLLGISACSVISGAGDDLAPTPPPTSIVSGLQVVSPRACQVAEYGMIRVDNPQGDLISWSPKADTLAYIAPTQGSSWNVGELYIINAPAFDIPDRLATQVAGELTWSPDATIVAYLSLRRSDGLFTIGLVYPDERTSQDLFPGENARTDGYASQKAILEWLNEEHLRVLTSCGVDCMQGVDFDILTGVSAPTGDPVQPVWGMWSPHTNHPTVISSALSDLAGQLNWSPDERLVAYVDENANPWIINIESESIYPLDIGQYAAATETDWSYDSQYLAVQADQHLKVFSFDCP